MSNLSSDSKQTRVINATAAGTSAVTGSAIDMQDFEGVVCYASLGTLTATQVTLLKAQGSSDNGVLDAYADITGAATAAAADADSNKMLVLDVYRPQKRYIKFIVSRGTANAVVDGAVAVQYGAKHKPTTNDATTTSQTKTFVGV